MGQDKADGASVNKVTLNSKVVNDNPNASGNDKTENEVKVLKEQLAEASKKLESLACCQQPFDEALSHYLATQFKKQNQRKRP